MLIVIEGWVVVGKSTVVRGLASHRNSKPLLEKLETNPFLPDFYEDRIENATETEFAFLLQHFHQLKAEAPAASVSEIIADFHLGKDLVYADLNLKDRRAKLLFRELYDLCLEKNPSPAVMIFLSATKDLLVKRMRAKDCDFESKIDYEYYVSVNAGYERYFARYPGKKLRIPMDEWDFVKDPSLYKQIASLIDIQLDTK